MNTRLTTISTIALLAVTAPMLGLAKNPHPTMSGPAITVDSCTCDDFDLNEATDPDQWESLCDVQWTTEDGAWPAYGASVEFEAEWYSDSEMSASSETELDEYSCETGDFDGELDQDDERCTAEDVLVVIPLYSDTGTVDFYAAVKGFVNGDTGGGGNSRDYVKVTGDCSPTPDLGD